MFDTASPGLDGGGTSVTESGDWPTRNAIRPTQLALGAHRLDLQADGAVEPGRQRLEDTRGICRDDRAADDGEMLVEPALQIAFPIDHVDLFDPRDRREAAVPH